ncbi:MAG: hypothetical protein ACRD94_08485 [Nitrosopumilaceae archaeon]
MLIRVVFHHPYVSRSRIEEAIILQEAIHQEVTILLQEIILLKEIIQHRNKRIALLHQEEVHLQTATAADQTVMVVHLQEMMVETDGEAKRVVVRIITNR